MTRLSPRERQIVECVGGEGLSNPATARKLGISIHTLKTHVRRIVKKAGDGRPPRELLVSLHWETIVRCRPDGRLTPEGD